MTRYERIIRDRAEKRRAGLMAACQDITQYGFAAGVKLRVFGSLARGRVGPGSDLDILVVDGYSSDNRYAIMARIQEIGSARDISVDVAFLDESPHLMEGSIPCP